ncbi:transporter substrate-binding domain-containing protein [uncultured Tateyamaria sp.]|uniref:substrate-binding periplasmic protein n=1 Tax=uncultured Tateyamaria sp. TaxID=455651 RepID=UPI002631629A|nr:transporter substrate-binding domain-containing protein [uncultured Tateyamaria sp.]
MKKCLSLLALAATLLGTVVQVAGDTPTIRAVADEWPPFSGAGLPGRGLSLDVITEVFARAGYTVESDVVPWARIMDGARRSEFDVVGSLFLDEELTAFLDYSDPFYATDVHLVQRTGETYTFTSVPALRPYTIAVGDGFLYEDEFDRADYLNKVFVTTTLQAMQMVAFGRADLTLDSVDVVNYAMRILDPTLASQLEIVPGALTSQNIHMAMRNDFPNRDQVLGDFNAALADMRADGTLDAILDRHVGD